MKLFGKSLFNNSDGPVELYDFAKHGLIRGESVDYVEIVTRTVDDGQKQPEATKKKKKEKTPKQVYELKSLNDDEYSINTSTEYVDKCVKSLERKMKLIPQSKRVKKDSGPAVFEESWGGSKYGYLELETLVERLNNRKKYEEHKEFFDEFPYTRSALINDVLADNGHLRSKRAEEFIPDMPDEAIDIMEQYNEHTQAICGKNAIFYIIADKKDFGEKDRKRDPILLAQSPFALEWQVLGAWDEEVIYLGDL